MRDLSKDPQHTARAEKAAAWFKQQRWTWNEGFDVLIGLVACLVHDDQWPIVVARLRELADDMERVCSPKVN